MENKEIFNLWCGSFNPRNMVELSKAFGWIEDAYATQGRHYHTMAHVGKLFDEILALPSTFCRKDILYHVALFHDIVYSRNASNNEQLSADYAATVLEDLGLEKGKILKIRELIQSTANHYSNDPLAQCFNDMDLSVLGSEPAEYETYTNQIRAEHSCVPRAIFNFYRKRFLKGMINKSRIFKTQFYFGKYEVIARRNMTCELNRIGDN